MCGGKSGRSAKAYCVEKEQVLCCKCVGLSTYPGMEGAEWTLEAIDELHGDVQPITIFIVNVLVVLFLLSALWKSGVSDEYFKGASTCPALGVGRQTLARFDATLFYYYKSSLASYCDIEDSFWRLLMDGWVRGVVSGSDSYLLLFSTLPKALLFKTAVSTFLKPIYAVLYATCGMMVAAVLIQLQDLAKNFWTLLPQGPGGPSPIMHFFHYLLKIPKKFKDFIFAQKTFFLQAKMVMWALAASVTLRFLTHMAGFVKLAATDKSEVTIWQLAFEPVLFWYLGRFFQKVQNKHSAIVAQLTGAASAAPTHPLTKPRERPKKDVMELLNYRWQRLVRSWRFYKQQAQWVIAVVFDDVFYMVILLRLVGILFKLAPIARQAVVMVGLGGMLDRHAAWFQEATGFIEVDGRANLYISDRLAARSFAEALQMGKVLFRAAASQAEQHNLLSLSTFMTCFGWRFLIPVTFYLVEKRWAQFLKKQNDEFKCAWKGEDWTTGEYSRQLERHGSFWNEVNQENWEAPTVEG